MLINPFLNVATAIDIKPLDKSGSKAAVVPDFAMTADEVVPVTRLMRSLGWFDGCLYNQETDEQPQLYFSHMIKVGDPYQLAREVRKGLNLNNSVPSLTPGAGPAGQAAGPPRPAGRPRGPTSGAARARPATEGISTVPGTRMPERATPATSPPYVLAACSGDGARASSRRARRPGSIRQSTSSCSRKWWNSAAAAWPAATTMMVQPTMSCASPTRWWAGFENGANGGGIGRPKKLIASSPDQRSTKPSAASAASSP